MKQRVKMNKSISLEAGGAATVEIILAQTIELEKRERR